LPAQLFERNGEHIFLGPAFATSPFDLNYRAASGHAAAAPPSSVMNSRRINGSNCIDARQPDPIRKP
jgi:hypothetical protein